MSYFLDIPEFLTPDLTSRLAELNRLNSQITPRETSPRVKDAFEYMLKTMKTGVEFSVSSILKLHELIGMDGKLRGKIEVFWSENNIAVGGIYHPAPAEHLEEILTAFVNKYNPVLTAESPFMKIAGAYLTFELIHPFRDGNGRIGRLIAAWLMNAYGYGALAPYLEEWMVNNNEKHAALFKSHVHNYLAWCNPSFHQDFLVYVDSFFNAFLQELIDRSLPLIPQVAPKKSTANPTESEIAKS